MNRGRILVMLIGVLAAPFLASAQVVITQIVYDPAGADAEREWIELLNAGTSSIRLTDFKLRTSGVNHKITAVSGGDTLPPQAYAAIVQDASLFAADNPSFTGPVFHASFSFTNKSGTVAIADKSGAIVATSSYQAPLASPASAKPAHESGAIVKNSKGLTFRKKAEIPPVRPGEEKQGTTMAASATQASSSSTFWWMGLIALLGTAGIAAFASPYVMKKRGEWEITEEKEDE